MNKRFLPILIATVIVLGIASMLILARQRARAAPPAAPDVPRLIGYQGRLTDAAGNPLTGDYDMRFCLYAAPTGGSALWCETHAAINDTAIPVSDGVFSAMLGSITPIPEPLFDELELYLGVKVEGDAEMTPRRRVVSVGYAYRAETAVDADAVDGMHAGDFESAGAVSTHAADPSAHHTRYTDAEAVAAIKAADGAGSGLDADIVDGIHASVAPEANKLVPLDANAKLPASVVPFKVYDSSWFAASSSSSYPLIHNLGTTKFLATVFFSANADGGNAFVCGAGDGDYNYRGGSSLGDITATTATFYTAWSVCSLVNSPGGQYRPTSGYVRIVLLALP